LAITSRTWSRGKRPEMGVVVGVSVVVGALMVGATDVDAGARVVAGIVVVATGSEAEIVEATPDVDEVDSVSVMRGSSTNGSLGTGRPATATPARPPTTITTRPNGQDLLMSQSS
jgi:hypothetical protein